MTFTAWQRFITDDSGTVLPGATIEVRNEATGALAVIYSSASGAAQANPFTADTAGFARFFAAGGRYQITATSGSFSASFRFVAIGSAQQYDVDPNSPNGLLTREQGDVRYGAGVQIFEINGPVTLDDTHFGKTALITDDAVITLPEWSAVDDGYSVEFLPEIRGAFTNSLATQGGDIVRGGRTTLSGDGAVVRSSIAGEWITVGEWDVTTT